MHNSKTWAMAAAAAAALTAAGLLTATALASPAHAAPRDDFSGYSVTTILNGANLSHLNSETGQREALTKPDDLTRYRGHLYTAFQNGVGPQGERGAIRLAGRELVQDVDGAVAAAEGGEAVS